MLVESAKWKAKKCLVPSGKWFSAEGEYVETHRRASVKLEIGKLCRDVLLKRLKNDRKL